MLLSRLPCGPASPHLHIGCLTRLLHTLPTCPPAGALLGAKVAPFWDPVIAIALSLFVVWAWGGQAQQHLLNLVGRSAPPDLLQRLTYLAFYHDERVQKIDTVRWVDGGREVEHTLAACMCLWLSTRRSAEASPANNSPPGYGVQSVTCKALGAMPWCRAFTLGSTYIAEVDIVLPPLTTVAEAHDIGAQCAGSGVCGGYGFCSGCRAAHVQVPLSYFFINFLRQECVCPASQLQQLGMLAPPGEQETGGHLPSWSLLPRRRVAASQAGAAARSISSL